MLWFALALSFVLVVASLWLWRGRLLKDRIWWAAWAVPVLAGGWLAWLVVSDDIVRKAVAALIMPTGLIWLGLGTALVISLAQRQWRPGVAWAAAFLAYGLAGNAWLGGWLMRGLESQVTAMPGPALIGHFDAVVVLGGGTSVSPQGGAQFGTHGDRIALGARLHLMGKADILVATGRSYPEVHGERNLADETRQLWRELGIGGEHIVMLSTPQDTGAEIRALKELIAQRGWTKIGLVSSAWHLPRALRLCARHGVAVTPLPADWRGSPPPFSLYWVIPQAQGFHGVNTACWEWLGMLVGR